MKVTVDGVRETMAELRRIDPELRKEFAADAKQIAQPIIGTAQSLYARPMPSGFARAWAPKGRKLFPWNLAAAQRGVKVKVSTSKKNSSTISVIQANPAAAMMEFAGTQNPSGLAQQLSAIYSKDRGRIMWQAADSQLDAVQREMLQAVERVSVEVNNKVRVI